MYKNNKNASGFTLIELVVVLVILAIIALIATPLVMIILDKAEDSANKRSVDGYGKSIEIAIANYLLDNGDYPTSIDNLDIEYSGSEVECKVKELNDDGSIFLTRCYVEGIKVKDSNTNDGWYHYGNSNIMPYQSYKIGDIVEYNGIKFYVVMDSAEDDDTVMLLKETPLTVNEVNSYSNGTLTITGTDYGLVKYSEESDCVYTGSYDTSIVKSIIDNWSSSVIGNDNLAIDNLGYKSRMLTVDELIDRLGYENSFYCSGGCSYTGTIDFVPTWVYNNTYSYWAIPSEKYVWNSIQSSGKLYIDFCDSNNAIRPVINLRKNSIKAGESNE